MKAFKKSLDSNDFFRLIRGLFNKKFGKYLMNSIGGFIESNLLKEVIEAQRSICESLRPI